MAITYADTTLSPAKIKQTLLNGRVVSFSSSGIAFKYINGILYFMDPLYSACILKYPMELDEFCNHKWYKVQVGYTDLFRRFLPKFQFILNWECKHPGYVKLISQVEAVDKDAADILRSFANKPASFKKKILFDFESTLDTAFIWSKTDQGLKYWRNIYSKLNNVVSQYGLY